MRWFGLVIAGALGSALLMASCCMPARAAAAGPRQTSAQVRDGSHDFDFFYGTWLLRCQRLKSPVLSSHDWVHFDATDTARPLPGGLGNEDFARSDYPKKGFMGMTLRLYDRATDTWRLYWIDNLHSHGDAGAPNVGRWHGNVGIFDSPVTVQGKPAIDRYKWTRFASGSKITAHFEESLSIDGGKTWKIVYFNDIIRAAPMGKPATTGSHENATRL